MSKLLQLPSQLENNKLCAKSYKHNDVVHFQSLNNCTLIRTGTFKRITSYILSSTQPILKNLKLSHRAFDVLHTISEYIFKQYISQLVAPLCTPLHKKQCKLSFYQIVLDSIKEIANNELFAKVFHDSVPPSTPNAPFQTDNTNQTGSDCLDEGFLIQTIQYLQERVANLQHDLVDCQRETTLYKGLFETLNEAREDFTNDTDNATEIEDIKANNFSQPEDTSIDKETLEEDMLVQAIQSLQQQTSALQNELNDARLDSELYKNLYDTISDSIVHDRKNTNSIATQTDFTFDDILDLENEVQLQKVKSLNLQKKIQEQLQDIELDRLTIRMQENAKNISNLQDAELDLVTEKVKNLNSNQRLLNEGRSIIFNLQSQLDRLQNHSQQDSSTQTNLETPETPNDSKTQTNLETSKVPKGSSISLCKTHTFQV